MATKKIEKAVESPVVPEIDVEALLQEHKTKSNVIRYLASQGKTRSEIAKLLNIRYQHVRNVLTQPLKRVREESSESK